MSNSLEAIKAQLHSAAEQNDQALAQLDVLQLAEPQADIQAVIKSGLAEYKQQGVTQDLVAMQADISISTLKNLKTDHLNSKAANLISLLDVLGYRLCVVKR